MRRRTRIIRMAALGLALGASMAPATAAFAANTSGTATITAGTLAITTPATVTFAATLNANDQTVNATQALDVLDGTGAAAGWKITATSTTFTSGANTLPTSAVTVQSTPTNSCDASTTCTLATNAVAFPYTLPAAAVAPAATSMYNAAIGTGMGAQTPTATVRLAIPASTKAGVYTSTWTYSIVTGP